jgi:hypothetical protein
LIANLFVENFLFVTGEIASGALPSRRFTAGPNLENTENEVWCAGRKLSTPARCTTPSKTTLKWFSPSPLRLFRKVSGSRG